MIQEKNKNATQKNSWKRLYLCGENAIKEILIKFYQFKESQLFEIYGFLR